VLKTLRNIDIIMVHSSLPLGTPLGI